MDTRHRRLIGLSALLAIVSLTALGGCSGTTSQGTLYNILPNRELETYFAADLEKVHNEALAAVVQDFGYTLQHAALDAQEGIITAHTAKENLVRVETYKHGAHVTRIELYVGPKGGGPSAVALLDKIESRLEAAGAGK